MSIQWMNTIIILVIATSNKQICRTVFSINEPNLLIPF